MYLGIVTLQDGGCWGSPSDLNHTPSGFFGSTERAILLAVLRVLPPRYYCVQYCYIILVEDLVQDPKFETLMGST